MNSYQSELVTVVIPTFNRAKYILETVDSVFKQTYRPIELIVFDDGSTDDSAEVIDNWQTLVDHDPFSSFRYVLQNNQGAPVARNHRLKIAKGEYIQFLDSDDKLDEEKIATQMKWYLEDSNIGLVISSSAYLSDCGIKPFRPHILPSGPVTKDQSMAWFFEKNVFIHDPLHKEKRFLKSQVLMKP